MHRASSRRAVKLYYKSLAPIRRQWTHWSSRTRFAFCAGSTLIRPPAKEDWKIIRVGQQKRRLSASLANPFGGAGALTGTPVAGSSLGGSSTTGGSSLFGSNNAGTGTTRPKCHNWRGSHGDNRQCDRPIGRDGGWERRAGQPAARVRAAVLAPQPVPGCPGRHLAADRSLAFHPTAPSSPSWFTRRRPLQRMGVYLRPLADQMMQGGNTGAIGQPVSNTTTPVGTGTPTGFSLNLNSNGTNGGSNSGGSSGNPPTAPTTPTPPPQ